jgi:hypothetical protein
LRLTKYALEPVRVEETDHFRLMRECYQDPMGFVKARSRAREGISRM